MISELSFTEYRALEGVNASAIKAGRKSMKHMHLEMTRETNVPTPAMEFGTIVHLALLEPDLLEDSLVIWNESKRTNKYKAFKEKHAGKHVVDDSQIEALKQMTASVASHPEAKMILEAGQKEVSAEWECEHTYRKGKGRWDVFAENELWADLKTASEIHPSKFQSHAEKFGYFHQAGWASEGMSRLGLSCEIPFYIVAIESSPPYDCVVFEIPNSDVEGAKIECRTVATKYRMSLDAGEFEGVASDGIQTLRRPEWAVNKPVLDFG